MTYLNNEVGAELVAFGKADNQNAKAGKAMGAKLAKACPNYETLEKPDQSGFRSEIAAYLIQALSVADQKILATKPSDLKPEQQVKRTNLAGGIRAQVSRLLSLAFPKERGHGAKRTIEQYLVDTYKAIIKRCEATDRGDWTPNVKLSYDNAKATLAGIK
mgnify:CR=1 FL=1